VLQAAVDRFGWTVAGAGPVEVGQYVSGSLAQGAAEFGDLDQRPGDAGVLGSVVLPRSSSMTRLSPGPGVGKCGDGGI